MKLRTRRQIQRDSEAVLVRGMTNPKWDHVAAGCNLSHMPLHGTIWKVDNSKDGRGKYGRLLDLQSVRRRYERTKSACEEGRIVSGIEFEEEELEENEITELRKGDYIKVNGGGMLASNRDRDIYLDAMDDVISLGRKKLSPQVDRPIVALAEALTQNTSLTKLIIGPGPWEFVHQEGYKPGRNSGFDRCWLSIPAINALAQMFRQNSTLEQLYLGKDSLSIM